MRATRLSVANYNTTLSSDSLESGTGSSNSLRSASHIWTPPACKGDCRRDGWITPAVMKNLQQAGQDREPARGPV
jgi:hypothetical protein